MDAAADRQPFDEHSLGGSYLQRNTTAQRHADRPLGALALETALCAIADAGLEVSQIDGFTTGALFPTAGAHTIEDGVSIVTSNWLAEHLRVNPRFASGFQGYGQIPGSVSLAVNADFSQYTIVDKNSAGVAVLVVAWRRRRAGKIGHAAPPPP